MSNGYNHQNLVLRCAPAAAASELEHAGVHPLLAQLFAARGVHSPEELDESLVRLIPPSELMGTGQAAVLLADAIAARQKICVVADYDCDGATACAVAVRGLRMLGLQHDDITYIVPDRAIHGYGLTPTLVDLALETVPGLDLLMTVDNGIASIDGVAHARARGLTVLVTDHHLPLLDDDEIVLPNANAMVNPSQPGDKFPSKSLAGVGVVFYVLMALRAELRGRGVFSAQNQPRLDALLDLVALGTVADVVKLDANNRRLVAQGLKRIRDGHMHAGLAALFDVAGRDPAIASSQDFGFALGPRINAAGRLADMQLGIECLLTDDPSRAHELAKQLDSVNKERRELESDMREQAEALLEGLMPTGAVPSALALFDPTFHEGVVGIVASRMKELVYRPTFIFARGHSGVLKGSGRSIPGFHLRDALDLISKRHPGVLLRFGGHAMAAGCTIAEDGFEAFDQALQQVASEWLDAAALSRTLQVDGALDQRFFNLETVQALDAQVWGQGFEPPVFFDELEVLSQRLVGERHTKLSLRHPDDPNGHPRDAIWFGRTEPLPQFARLAYKISVNEFRGRRTVQMVVEGAEAA